MENLSLEQLRRLYNSDRSLFNELAEKWRVSDSEYYNNYVLPIIAPTFESKKNPISLKRNSVVVGVSVIVALIIIVSYIGAKKTKETKIPPNETVQDMELSDFQKGMNNFNDGYFKAAKNYFEKIADKDSSYLEAQKMIAICNGKILESKKEEEKLEAKKMKLRAKYNKLCKSGYYQYEIVNKLADYHFYQESSGFVKAPDGHTGLKRVFTKTEDGCKIIFTLQDAYDMHHYYCDIEIQ